MTEPTEPAYPAAREAARRVRPHFERAWAQHAELAAALPDPAAMEALIDAAFWASLRREEGYSPRISLVYLPPETTGTRLHFEQPLKLEPEVLTRLSPAADRPGIHLGVWMEAGELRVWGATRTVPAFCFVLEVVAPGLLAIKHRGPEQSAKFVNVAVLEGDRVKVVDVAAASLPAWPNVVSSLAGLNGADATDSIDVLVELAVSMRAHGRGGALLIVPAGTTIWRDSVMHPINYAISPPFSKLAILMQEAPESRREFLWRESFYRAVETVAGLTSVDGATVINDRYEVLAFGAKIRRRQTWAQVEQVVLTEPIENAATQVVSTNQVGGTRHVSAAQFVHDQPDAAALVASQDGRFTVFGWSPADEMVHAHRVETLLL